MNVKLKKASLKSKNIDFSFFLFRIKSIYLLFG
jgi:hypothetical protein